jgi:transmembrane sensor
MNTATDQRQEALLTAAAEWFQRMREEEPTADAITGWLAWCAADPEHERAYRDVQEMWMLAGDAGIEEWPSEQALRDDAYGGEISVDAWNAQLPQATAARVGTHTRAAQGSIDDSRQLGGAPARTRRPRRLMLTRAASVLVAVGALWMTWRPDETVNASGVFTTERGASRQLALPDGSLVTLGAASELRVAYRPDRRELFLGAGEAFFRVHHDKTVPFVVHSRGVAITAVGTAFNVRADAASTVVAVTEGIVSIDAEREPSGVLPISKTHSTDHSPPPAPPEPITASIRARVGDEVTIDGASHVAVQPTTAAAALGWIEGSLTFVDEPLSVVLARLNRNNAKELILADHTVGQLRFTGTVFKNQVAEWASGLDRVFPVRAIARADGSVLLVPADNSRR